jgi:ABC-type branched-subunit amino acid transport system substrate-binding protein
MDRPVKAARRIPWLLRAVPAFLVLVSLPRAAAPAPMTVGVLAPLNGPDAPYGVGLTNGVDLALALHERSGLYPIGVKVEDTSGGEDKVIRKSLDLLDRSGAEVLLGEIWSVRTFAVAGIVLARGMTLISPVAPHPDIGRLGEGVYSLAGPRRRQLDRLLLFARDSLGVRTPAVLYPETEEGSALQSTASSLWNSLGMSLSQSVPYRPGQHDFVAELDRCLERGADAILTLGTSREVLSLVSHGSQSGFLGPYLGLENLGTEENLHLFNERLCMGAFADDSYSVALSEEGGPDLFDQIYRQKYGTSADTFARHGFLAFRLIGLIVESSHGNPSALREGFEALRDPLLPPRDRFLRPPEDLARVRLVLLQSGAARDVW